MARTHAGWSGGKGWLSKTSPSHPSPKRLYGASIEKRSRGTHKFALTLTRGTGKTWGPRGRKVIKGNRLRGLMRTGNAWVARG